MTRLAAMVVLAGAVAARGQEAPADAGGDSPAPRWTSRLEALVPEKPEMYLELGEEVADGASAGEETALARQLYGLAFVLDLADGGSSEVAAAACLALASVESSGGTKRWLHALAGSVDRRYAQADWTVVAARGPSEQTALAAATALGLARSGEGNRAREIVRDRSVLDLITAYERVMSTTGNTGAVFRFQRAIDAWPCPECSNARVVTRQGAEGSSSRLCYTCRGNPGPELSEMELIVQLRFESVLLNGIHRSWGAQITADQGVPLRDPDPEELAPYLGVSAEKAVWRDGGWAAR